MTRTFHSGPQTTELQKRIKNEIWEIWKQYWPDENIRERYLAGLLRSCTRLLNNVYRHWSNDPDVFDYIEEAIIFAVKCHGDQKPRKTGEPYIMHPLNVANTCAEHGLDKEGIVSALLHDVIEDTPVQREKLVQMFGYDVGEIVDALSKVKSKDTALIDRDKVATFFKIFGTAESDNLLRTILIKLFDRMDNMKTVEVFRPSKQTRYAQETIYIYSSLANILGMRFVATELIVKSLKPFFPDKYDVIKLKSEERLRAYAEDNRKVQDLINSFIKNKIPVKFIHFYPTIADFLDPVTKNVHYDILPLKMRIRVPKIVDMYTVLGLIHSMNLQTNNNSSKNPGIDIISDSLKDYVVSPLANGYRALTTKIHFNQRTWLLEIVSMDIEGIIDWGILSDFQNKSLRDFYFTGIKAFQNNIRNIANIPYKDLQSLTSNAVGDIQIRYKNDKLIRLPFGSHVIDLAYLLSDELGLYCKGAIVNGVFEQPLYKLHHGEQIEILTQAKPLIKHNFLDVMASNIALTKYKNTIRKYYMGRASNIGKKILRKFIDVNAMDETIFFDEKGESVLFTNEELINIGLSKNSVYDVIQKHKIDVPVQGIFKKKVLKIPRIIDDINDFMFNFPSCCNVMPIVDEDVVMQYDTEDKDRVLGLIDVHFNSCPQLKPDIPKIPIIWDVEFPNMVPLLLYVNDSIGLAGEITGVVGRNHLNILSLHADSTLRKPLDPYSKQVYRYVIINIHLRSGENKKIDQKRLINCIKMLRKIQEVKKVTISRG
jgi:GTP diphosphokinase / guanosine-3',5'-bis(diphosphate) 3'-diphosphatase